VTPVKDTVWWNTQGGRVMEHRDDTDASCSLMLYDDAGSVTFEWDDPGRTSITAINTNWQFPDQWNVPLAMQFGEAWLNNGNDSAVIDGIGHGNAVVFTTEQAIDELLRPADHIEIRTRVGEMSIRVPREKLNTLLAQAQACRKVARR
jgi:hypothetical protein